MRSLSLAALFLALAPSSVMAQPVFTESATLHVEGEMVGWLRGAPSVITGWPQEGQAQLHYEDEIIAFDARVDLSASETRVLASVAQQVTLEATPAFQIDMLPATFARVVGRDAAGRLRVRLPDSLPHRIARMPLGSPVMPIAPPDDPDFPDLDGWDDYICRPTRVLSRPSPDATVWMADGPSTRVELGTLRGGYRAVRIWIEGYIVHGFLDSRLPDMGCGGGGFSTGCGGRYAAAHTRVTMPALTPLFGTALAAAPFATLRIPYLATMVAPGPIPDAPTAWRITRDEDDGPRWALEVFVRASADALRSYPSPPEPVDP